MSVFNKVRHRSYQPELMDDLAASGEDLRQNLRELAIINRWLGGNRLTTDGLAQLRARCAPAAPWRVADLGCGGGDMLRHMADWAHQHAPGAQLVGVDANAYTLEYARQRTAAYPQISYQRQNVFSAEFASQRFDVVTATLFCHHFDEAALLMLLRQLRTQARCGIVLNDLHRHWLAYHAISVLTGWFSRSAFVRHDARLSVWRGFSRAELAHLLRQAGYADFRIRWRWAFRWQVVAFTTD